MPYHTVQGQDCHGKPFLNPSRAKFALRLLNIVLNSSMLANILHMTVLQAFHFSTTST